MPMAGLTGSHLLKRFRTIKDPYSRDEWAAIPAIKPDWTIVHAQEADADGNTRLLGSKYDDLLKAKAAAHVIVTCERVVSATEVASRPELTDLPGFLVDAVVHVPRGAWPGSCFGEYGPDEAYLQQYLTAASAEDSAYAAFVAEKAVTR